eukprot:351773-Chlamydomonas_euryale.AAC.10
MLSDRKTTADVCRSLRSHAASRAKKSLARLRETVEKKGSKESKRDSQKSRPEQQAVHSVGEAVATDAPLTAQPGGSAFKLQVGCPCTARLHGARAGSDGQLERAHAGRRGAKWSKLGVRHAWPRVAVRSACCVAV